MFAPLSIEETNKVEMMEENAEVMINQLFNLDEELVTAMRNDFDA